MIHLGSIGFTFVFLLVWVLSRTFMLLAVSVWLFGIVGSVTLVEEMHSCSFIFPQYVLVNKLSGKFSSVPVTSSSLLAFYLIGYLQSKYNV